MKPGWRIARLGEICTFNYGKALPESARKGGSTPVFGSNGVVGHHDVPITSGRTIVIGRKGSFGEVNYSEVPSWPIDTAYFVDEASTEQDIRWLFHRLGSLGLNQMNKAAAVPGLNRDDAYRKEVLLPPLSDQRRIATILDKADALRTKRRDALTQLDRLAQSIFVEMFGDPTANPRGWPKERLDAITECLDKHRRPVTESERPPGDVPYYGANGQQGWIDEYLFDESLVLVAEDGGHFESPSRGVAYRVDGKSWVNNHAHILRPRVGKLGIEYLHRALRHFNFVPYISGTTRSKLTQGQLNSVELMVPPLRLQEQFAARVERVVLLGTMHRVAADSLDVLFSSLQRRAFRGEL